MTPEVSATLRWGVEVERGLLAILWWHPHLIGLVRRELDPSIHFTLPCHRHILDAISIVYSEIGDVTWETVVQVIREIPKAFDECGGKQGLNNVYTDEGHYPCGSRNPEPIVAEYIRLLKNCAIQRGIDPTKPVLHYTVARGILQLNKLAIKPEHPTVIGYIYAPAPGLYTVAGWPQGESQLKIKGQLDRSRK